MGGSVLSVCRVCIHMSCFLGAMCFSSEAGVCVCIVGHGSSSRSGSPTAYFQAPNCSVDVAGAGLFACAVLCALHCAARPESVVWQLPWIPQVGDVRQAPNWEVSSERATRVQADCAGG